MNRHPFTGRRAIIVTKHGKERAILPLVSERFAMYGEMLIIDTDAFGTFTGEIERKGSQLDALRAKLHAGAVATPYDGIVIASEGAFFPDPAFPMVTVDRELVGMLDLHSGLEIIGSSMSYDTNMTRSVAPDEAALQLALLRLRFPIHAAIIRTGDTIHKGLRDPEAVRRIVRDIWQAGAMPIVESDMRAHMNPTRMVAVADACRDALARAASRCPECNHPGFWAVDKVPGLSCGECGHPTTVARATIWSCEHCHYRREEPVGIAADPAFCDACNP